MKKIFILFLAAATLAACSDNKKSQSTDSTRKTTSSNDQTAALIKKFGTLLKGDWIKKDYLDEIVKTKSPQLAYEKVGTITEFDIDPSDIKGDSILVNYNSGNHEVFKFTIKFKRGDSPNSIIAHDPGTSIDQNNYEIKVDDNGSTLILYTLDKNRKVTNSDVYLKFSKKDAENVSIDQFQYIINKHLWPEITRCGIL